MKNIPLESNQTTIVVKTSRTSPELAKKIQEVSARIMKQNYQLYKDLENK